MLCRKMKALALASAMALGVSAPVPAFAGAAKPSPFLQCDGRTGHVSGGERFMRLLLVTATAGLSETGMASDKDSLRLKGTAGVEACDAAIASENDGYRRIQLGLARALHVAETGKWAEAAAAAHIVPRMLDGLPTDWALARTAETAAANIEAWALVHAGQLAEAEELQAKAALRADADALALQRTAPYLRLTRTMSETKRRAFEHLFRYAPQYEALVLNGYADARQYRAARAALADTFAVQTAMYRKPPSTAEMRSLDAAFAAMDGNAAEARTLLDQARASFARERAEGTGGSSRSASIDEQIAFAEAALALADGKAGEARRLIGQRSLWSNVAPGMVIDLVDRLNQDIPAADRVGILKDSATVWSDVVAGRVATLTDESYAKNQWNSLTQLVVDKHYAPLWAQAASGSSAKPKWLLKADKDEPLPFEIVTVDGRFYGAMVGEPLLLHAAYIARARGKRGFVLFPTRKELATIGVKFVDPGELGITDAAIVNADTVIKSLGPRLTAVAAQR